MHKNIPNMLSQISGLVSEAGVNIDNMTNRSRKEYAYTILDVVSDQMCIRDRSRWAPARR